MGFLDRCKCDATNHDESCPKWCDLRPGGATRPVPYTAKATTITPPREPAATGGC